MKKILLFLALALTISCAGKTTPLQTAQISHSTLALAQDMEAQLCFGVADAYHITGDKTHCTTETAKTIGLTDERHKALAENLKKAFDLHAAAAVAGKAGSAVDSSSLNAAIQAAIAIIQQLVQTPSVVQLLTNVQNGAK